ncbi:hypothetical protein VKT23_006538 [Stygiomarasmius scandens]|uniref:Uncharacterized protein n=1 Tax=Marasmiellus scandens TaxID=2682957 RepID=A0ABR1JQL7_9AGAR
MTDPRVVSRLTRIFHEAIDKKQVKNHKQFIEAICVQPDATICMDKLIRKDALRLVREAIQSDLGLTFLNGPAMDLLRFLQTPEIKTINSGQYLERALQAIMEPPIFWNAFLDAFNGKKLEEQAQRSFGWLLLQLLTLPGDTVSPYLPDAEAVLPTLITSPILDIRNAGQKIKHTISVVSSPPSAVVPNDNVRPGGRHDNDFADFRQIAILPTPDELASIEPPFLRPSSVLDDPSTESCRAAIYLDNQFRLLREDMIYELREELQIALGKQKGKRHRGFVVEGLRIVGVELGPVNRRVKWGMTFQCDEDLPRLKDISGALKRKKFLEDNPKMLKHQSLTCLIIDGNVMAFPSVRRDENLLAMKPPKIVLEIEGDVTNLFLCLKSAPSRSVKLIQIDVAVFSYEPILNALKLVKELPLSDELLFWKNGSLLCQPLHSPELSRIVHVFSTNPKQDIQGLLQTNKSVVLDNTQAESLLSGLNQKLSIIQGPPGTGKSFIGALLAKFLHQFSPQKILVVCYTNHALDQFLEDLLDIGIPIGDMVRIGGKSTLRTEPMMLQKQKKPPAKNGSFGLIDDLKKNIEIRANSLDAAFKRYVQASVNNEDLLIHLEFDEPDFFEAFRVPVMEDGMKFVNRKGKEIEKDFLLYQWKNGWDAGMFKDEPHVKAAQEIWNMSLASRRDLLKKWTTEILKTEIAELYDITAEYNRLVGSLTRVFRERDMELLRSKRIIGCTTTAAAKYGEDIQAAIPDVVLVEEAGEILESHVVTALGATAKQLILIGDHKQLRPKVNNYKLTVEKEEGYDLNVSLFERLVLKGYPHKTLVAQHRMRPEISALIRHLTYPDLQDAPKTKNRPGLYGVQDNIVFINHSKPEDDLPDIADGRDFGSKSSKQNTYEARMVLKIVRYLAQQGYGTDEMVVLTPYLGQLSKLRKELQRDMETDPVLNDLDSYDLIRAGLLTAGAAKPTKRKLRLATIDNYQGEESEIVIVSLTRSNSANDIGFMFSPERLNVLLSRARNALIMIGNSDTFTKARRGKEMWQKLFEFLKKQGHIYDGFPVKCEQHPDRVALLATENQFDTRPAPQMDPGQRAADRRSSKIKFVPDFKNLVTRSNVDTIDSVDSFFVFFAHPCNFLNQLHHVQFETGQLRRERQEASSRVFLVTDSDATIRSPVWHLAFENSKWYAYCNICHDTKGRNPYTTSRHEDSPKHQENLAHLQRRNSSQGHQVSPNPQAQAGGVPILSLGDLAATRLLQTFQSPHVHRESLPPASSFPLPSHVEPYAPGFDWDEFEAVQEDTNFEDSRDKRSIAELSQSLTHLFQYGPDQIDSDDNSFDERSVASTDSGTSSENNSGTGAQEQDDIFEGPTAKRARKSTSNVPVTTEWFPWEDRVTCTLDILMHLPRSIFSSRQLDLFLWLLRVNGVQDVPSVKSMKDLNSKLQALYGIETYKYKGALGHVYYVNSIADIVAQEMSNPKVRPHLCFYPEDSGTKLSEARHADRWLNEMADDLIAPMARLRNKDYYVFEPAMISGALICMPHRWFERNKRMIAKCWKMQQVRREDGRVSWRVVKDVDVEVDEGEFLKPFDELCRDIKRGLYTIPDVTIIEGFSFVFNLNRMLADVLLDVLDSSNPDGPEISSWNTTNPVLGNPWRARARGHRCLAFPLWLYCDDTSGNTSKKWNKHNSFLMIPAGLPREHSSKEYNVHFLSTSNIAPPLEMLDGIADQIWQEYGIWAWDAETDEPVLLVLSVLALLGDNPMQSEFACHIGLRGKFFCRHCWVKGKDAADSKTPGRSDAQAPETDETNASDESDAASIGTAASDNSATGGKAKRKRRKTVESLKAMVDRVTNFIKPGVQRKKAETIRALKTQFTTAKSVGASTTIKKLRTETGIKDTYQTFFIDKLVDSYKGRFGASRQCALDTLLSSLPEDPISPVWRIKGLDPHCDTPVEVLHVVLLGFLKYMWRDVIKNQLKDNTDKKAELIARLSSIDVAGLGIDQLNGETLVNYAGSLTGSDFRKIAQVAPFVLKDFVSDDCYQTWVALSKLVPLIWQPEIHVRETYLETLRSEIDNFLLCAARWTVRWFNKPKFHILVHLPEHIRRFGPAMLFATETFESFNAVIREKSVHSNRQSPSHDIARAFAQGNRIRHFLSGGLVLLRSSLLFDSVTLEDRVKAFENTTLPQCQRVTAVQHYFRSYGTLSREHWTRIGRSPLALGHSSESTVGEYLGISPKGRVRPTGECKFPSGSKAISFNMTRTGELFPDCRLLTQQQIADAEFKQAASVVLGNGDKCSQGMFVTIRQDSTLQIAQVVEILRCYRSRELAVHYSELQLVLVQVMDLGDASEHGMPHLQPSGRFFVLEDIDLLCTVNVQHDCIRNGCQINQTRIVRQERELTEHRKGEILHAGSKEDYVLNTAQMRDAKYVQHFRLPLKPLIHSPAHIIQASCTRECKPPAKAKNPARPTNSRQSSSVTPQSALSTSSLTPMTTQNHPQSSFSNPQSQRHPHTIAPSAYASTRLTYSQSYVYASSATPTQLPPQLAGHRVHAPWPYSHPYPAYPDGYAEPPAHNYQASHHQGFDDGESCQ